jgi:protein-tyrosine kinase
MSRVFEALTKASQEKKQEAKNATGVAKSELDNVERAKVDRPRMIVPFGEEGGSRKSMELPLPSTNGHKSWRERLEEVFFGWDLRKYHNFPIVALEDDSAASEQYKILREQIKRLRAELGIKSFTITSPVKRDGKTTVAVNLAAVLALDYDEKVLLIDGDLRAPGVHRYFNTPLSPGLADYLASGSKMDIKDMIQETFLPGLRVLPAGRPSHLSSELLAREKMKQAAEEIRAEFAEYHLIVDSPPVLSTPDPLVIARHVDGVMLVIRAGKTPRDYLTKALQSLNSTKIMGIVLNGAELGRSAKYYYYSRGPF